MWVAHLIPWVIDRSSRAGFGAEAGAEAAVREAEALRGEMNERERAITQKFGMEAERLEAQIEKATAPLLRPPTAQAKLDAFCEPRLAAEKAQHEARLARSARSREMAAARAGSAGTSAGPAHCTVCGKKFKSEQGARDHARAVHGGAAGPSVSD